MNKDCHNCQHVKRFTADDGTWMDVCTSEEAEDIDEGLWRVSVVDKEAFDATHCLDFKQKVTTASDER